MNVLSRKVLASVDPTKDWGWIESAVRRRLSEDRGVAWHEVKEADGTGWRLMSAPVASAEAVQGLQTFYETTMRLSSQWVDSPAALLRSDDELLLVLAGNTGRAVAPVRDNKPESVSQFLKTAAAAAEALAHVHGAGILHRAIRPSALREDEAGAVTLTGFIRAVAQDRKSSFPVAFAHALDDADILYAAPEQARRTRPYSDERSDLYSLGVSLYELLTGRPPFEARTRAEWLHAHLAVEPAPPSRHRSGVPAALDAVILKLMAKDPADRYRSAGSLCSDLRRTLAAWLSSGAFTAVDARPAYRARGAARRLFGRGDEAAALVEAWRRVQADGAFEMVLLAGAGGAGKSCLVERLPQFSGQDSLNMLTGKADALQEQAPFALVRSVLGALVAQLLVSSAAVLSETRARLLKAVAGHGQLIVDLVPDANIVLGKSAALSDLLPDAARERIVRVILAALSAFASADAPLVLFLDDLQWADEDSLEVLKAVIAAAPAHMLLIGAYRDDEADRLIAPGGVIRLAREGVAQLTEIHLAPLSQATLTDLVAAALGRDSESVLSLAEMVHERTAGNPFFVDQLLGRLFDDHVIAYDVERGIWAWNDADVAAYSHAEDVLEFLVEHFEQLRAEPQDMLRLLACIGRQADKQIVERLAGSDAAETRRRIQPLIDAGLVLVHPARYVISHDRVLEAAYAVTPLSERRLLHAQIARLMIEVSNATASEAAFEIATHIERVGDDVPAGDRVPFVIALLAAARGARTAAAVARALQLLESARALAVPAWWTAHYELMFDLHLLECECLIAGAMIDEAETSIDALLLRAGRPLDTAAVHRLKAMVLTVRSDYVKAIEAALEGLNLLGVVLERRPVPADYDTALRPIRSAMGGRRLEDVSDLPTMEDPSMRMAMSLLSTLISSMFVEDEMRFLHVAKMVELTFKHGRTPDSAYGLAWFGVMIAHRHDAYHEGFAYGQAALALVRRHGYAGQLTATLVAVDQLSPWVEPLSDTLGHIRSAIAAGRSAGDVGMTCYARNHLVSDLIVSGEHLSIIVEEADEAIALTRQVGYSDIEHLIGAQRRLVRDLQVDPARTPVVGAEPQIVSYASQFWARLYEGMGAYFAGDYADACISLGEAEALLWTVPAHIDSAYCVLFKALAETAAADASNASAVVARVRPLLDRLATWAELNPLTFTNKQRLVEAQIAYLEGDALLALRRFDESIMAAAAAGFVHEEAMARERAAGCYEDLGFAAAAQLQLNAAHDAYVRWGAAGKAKRMAQIHPRLAANARPERVADGADHAILDLDVITRVSQTLSEEIPLDRVIETLMSNIIIHAGADHGVLVLLRGPDPVVQAEGRVVEGDVVMTTATTTPTNRQVPAAILNEVMRTWKPKVIEDAKLEWRRQVRTPMETAARSVLALPLLSRGALIGMIYLENHLAPGVFTPERTTMTQILASQAAVSIEMARLYSELLTENVNRTDIEFALRKARVELAQTSHLTVMGELAASISHEINQPLASILALSSAGVRWLQRSAPDVGEALETFHELEVAANRAADIVSSLRSLAKQTPPALTSLSIYQIVEDVLRITAGDVEANKVVVEARLQCAQHTVHGDPIQLQQVVLNLITNAIDAMEATPIFERRLTVGSALEDGFVKISVGDAGKGLPQGDAERIFGAMFTTKEKGMGMGLAICRSIIQSHGGQIGAVQRERGTELWFTLPLRPN